MEDKRGVFSPRRLTASFHHAISGFLYAARTEKNMQIHLIASVLTVLAGIVFRVSAVEWLFLLLCIFGVWALELVNSAIEKAIDLSTEDIHPLAKQAKDMAAAAVLVFAIFSVLAAAVIFGPKMMDFF